MPPPSAFSTPLFELGDRFGISRGPVIFLAVLALPPLREAEPLAVMGPGRGSGVNCLDTLARAMDIGRWMLFAYMSTIRLETMPYFIDRLKQVSRSKRRGVIRAWIVVSRLIRLALV